MKRGTKEAQEELKLLYRKDSLNRMDDSTFDNTIL